MSATVRVLGLRHCDSCRRALRWLDARGVSVDFGDIREAPHTATAVALARASDDWAAFVNRRSTTWRALPDEDRRDLTRTRALTLLAANPTLFKRPLLVIDDVVQVGFDEARLAGALT
jgi:Spx/MgsR family transcriptional regulator